MSNYGTTYNINQTGIKSLTSIKSKKSIPIYWNGFFSSASSLLSFFLIKNYNFTENTTPFL